MNVQASLANEGFLIVLGLSFDYHDAAAVLWRDGDILAAAQEERFTRIKHDASLPVNAIRCCLEFAGCANHELDLVVYYENPFEKFARILKATHNPSAQAREYRDSVLKTWMSNGKLEVHQRIAEHLGIPKQRVQTIDHHVSHAASAFYCSPFDQATVITFDAVGEFETTSISVGKGLDLAKLRSVMLPHSLGLFYSALTAYLGFEVNEGEYKVMGMAGFGEPKYYDVLKSLVSLSPDGLFTIHQDCFEFLTPVDAIFNQGLTELLGPARKPESAFDLSPENEGFAENKRFADVAASIQKLTEDVMLHIVSHAIDRTGIRDVCLAGGCALNSLANARLVKELGINLFVQPAAGDAGGALGAALYGAHSLLRHQTRNPLTHCYYGSLFDDAAIARAIGTFGLSPHRVFADEYGAAETAAGLIADGNVVGWFQGRSEWGPRALGARSILADPTRADMKKIVNEKIKFREPFRPFAPAVIAEKVEDYFDVSGPNGPSDPKNYMLQVCAVKPTMRDRIPAVTHVDGTARVQTVHKDVNPLFYRLIEDLGNRNGVPVVLNTSFNLRGEPIVDGPEDAIKTFCWSDMDYLVLGKYLLNKKWLV